MVTQSEVVDFDQESVRSKSVKHGPPDGMARFDVELRNIELYHVMLPIGPKIARWLWKLLQLTQIQTSNYFELITHATPCDTRAD